MPSSFERSRALAVVHVSLAVGLWITEPGASSRSKKLQTKLSLAAEQALNKHMKIAFSHWSLSGAMARKPQALNRGLAAQTAPFRVLAYRRGPVLNVQQ